jgi:predicted ATP-dependent endonuclease of OLD family
MYIEKIVLKNFKSFESLEYDVNRKFNVIIGENNIGKTTLFDSILLWGMAYKQLITADGKNFYKKTQHNSMNINFNKLLIFRIVNAVDLFHTPKEGMYIAIVVNNNGVNYNLRIDFDIPTIEDSYIRVRNHNTLKDFQAFAEICKSQGLRLPDVVSISFTKPVSFIDREELFLNKAQIHRRSYIGKNYETLRNKILNTQSERKFEYLENKISKILNKPIELSYKNPNRDDEEYIKINVKIGDNKEIDLSLVGSGILHILEIFSSLYVKEKNEEALNIILIDEPDSHIHSDLQAKIIDELKADEHRQIFIISHNERILSQTNLGELFYLSKWSKKNSRLSSTKVKDFIHIKRELGGKLYELESIEENKPLLFVEGESDKEILFKSFELYDDELLEILNIIPSGGHDGVKNNVIGWSFLNRDNMAIGMFDYDMDTKKSIKEIHEVSKNENFKILKLKDYLPQHLIQFFQKGVKLPFAIEEMFNYEFWKHFDAQNWLEEKKDIIQYNKEFSSINETFRQYCQKKQIDCQNLIYLKKVKLHKKEKASKYICKHATWDNFSSLRTIVEEIRRVIS